MSEGGSRTKIFGQHDEATIKQIETCVAAGGERAVLCADGHKGYAQPIGGVVAYDAGTDHEHGLRHHGVDLARHDAGSGLEIR